MDAKLTAIVQALKLIEQNAGTEGFRMKYDQALHIMIALERAGFKVVLAPQRKA